MLAAAGAHMAVALHYVASLRRARQNQPRGRQGLNARPLVFLSGAMPFHVDGLRSIINIQIGGRTRQIPMARQTRIGPRPRLLHAGLLPGANRASRVGVDRAVLRDTCDNARQATAVCCPPTPPEPWRARWLTASIVPIAWVTRATSGRLCRAMTTATSSGEGVDVARLCRLRSAVPRREQRSGSLPCRRDVAAPDAGVERLGREQDHRPLLQSATKSLLPSFTVMNGGR